MDISRKYLKRQLFFCLCIITYKLGLDAYYVIFSSDFAYYGVIYDPRGSLEIIISWICLITSTFFVDFSDKKVSNSVHTSCSTSFASYQAPSSIHLALAIGRKLLLWSICSVSGRWCSTKSV